MTQAPKAWEFRVRISTGKQQQREKTRQAMECSNTCSVTIHKHLNIIKMLAPLPPSPMMNDKSTLHQCIHNFDLRIKGVTQAYTHIFCQLQLHMLITGNFFF